MDVLVKDYLKKNPKVKGKDGIYAIQAPNEKVIKVGKATDIQTRLTSYIHTYGDQVKLLSLTEYNKRPVNMAGKSELQIREKELLKRLTDKGKLAPGRGSERFIMTKRELTKEIADMNKQKASTIYENRRKSTREKKTRTCVQWEYI